MTRTAVTAQQVIPWFMGIDPGLKGAIAIIQGKVVVELVDIPVVEIATKRKRKKGKKKGKPGKRREYDTAALAEWFLLHRFSQCALAVIELVGAMPHQGLTSTFRFGWGAGFLEGMLAACRVPYQRFSPGRWKRVMLADIGADPNDKKASLLQAKRLFPVAAPLLERSKDDGRAEALLMAEFARRVYHGQAVVSLQEPEEEDDP